MSLPVSDIVSVQILVAPSAPVARGFGVGFLLGSNTLPLEERMRLYSAASEVNADAQMGAAEKAYATAYFGQSPAPEKLRIGNRFTTAQSGKLRGAGISTVLSTYTGITNGGFDISIDGTNRQIFALNLSGAASMAAIATLIQTKLNAALAGTTCTWNGTNFVIASPTTGTSSIVGYAVAPTGGSSPTDASTILGFSVAAGALSVNGIAIETLTDSLAASYLFNPDFYGVSLTSAASTQDIKDAMAWAESNKLLFWFTTNDPNALLSVATSDLGYYAKNLGYNRTASFYDATNPTPYLSGSAQARMATVDYEQPDSVTTLKFKQAPGFAPAPLNSTQAANAKAKNYNIYVERGTGFSMFEEGVVANGRFIDEVIGLDWLQATVQNAMFSVLALAPTGVPLTDAGVGKLVQAASNALARARSNGLLAPGQWNGNSLGEVKSGDYLPNGYYVFAQPVADQLPAERSARSAPAITAIGVGAGAIHNCALTFIFQR